MFKSSCVSKFGLEKFISKEEMKSYKTIEEAIKDILKKIRK